jgi:hypothetical protein
VIALWITLVALALSRSTRTNLSRSPQLLVPWACGIAATWLVFTVLGERFGAWFAAIGSWQTFEVGVGLWVPTVLALWIELFVTAWATASTLLVAQGVTARSVLGDALALARRPRMPGGRAVYRSLTEVRVPRKPKNTRISPSTPTSQPQRLIQVGSAAFVSGKTPRTTKDSVASW